MEPSQQRPPDSKATNNISHDATGAYSTYSTSAYEPSTVARYHQDEHYSAADSKYYDRDSHQQPYYASAAVMPTTEPASEGGDDLSGLLDMLPPFVKVL